MVETRKRFADKYFETLNATLSATYAGYSEDTAKQQGYFLLQQEEVQEYLEKLRAEFTEKTGITKEWIIERFRIVSDACVKAIPVMGYDAKSKTYIAVTDENGDPVYEFDSSGANKATEMLGKIFGVFEKDNAQRVQENPQVIIVGGKKIEF